MENAEETSNMSGSDHEASINTQSNECTDETTNQSNEYTDDNHQSPEYLQRKLYFLLEQLKTMHSELPEYEIY